MVNNLKRFLKKVHLFYYALIAGCFIYLLSISWCKCGDLLIDVFEQQWIFYKLARGEALYKDIFCQYGFLPFYSVSFLHRIFGVSIYNSIAAGVVITAAVSVFLYRIARLYLPRLFSALFIISFLFIIPFNSKYLIYSFVLPGNIANTFSLLFTIAALYCFMKYFRNGRECYLRYWCVLMYAAFLSRIYYALAAWLIFTAVAAYGIYLCNKPRRALAVLSIPLLLSVVSYAIFLFTHDAFGAFYETVIRRLVFFSRGLDTVNSSKLGIYSYITGNKLFVLDENVYQILKGFIINTLLVTLFYFISDFIELLKLKFQLLRNNSVPVLIAAVSSAVIVFYYTGSMEPPYEMQYCFLQLLLLASIGIMFARRASFASGDFISLIALFSVSIALLSRSFFRLSLHDNTFLFIPGLIGYYIFYLKLYPLYMDKYMPLKNKSTYAAMLFVYFAAVNIPTAMTVVSDYRTRDYAVSTDRGKFVAPANKRTIVFWQVVDYVKSHTPADATMVVFPEGVSVNFFSGRDNPLECVNYIPAHMDMLSEESIIDQLRRHDVDYIVVLNRPVPEYGFKGFGKDYGAGIYNWITTAYVEAARFGEFPFTANEFGAVVLKKKDQ